MGYEDQPRDDHGMWTDGAGETIASNKAEAAAHGDNALGREAKARAEGIKKRLAAAVRKADDKGTVPMTHFGMQDSGLRAGDAFGSGEHSETAKKLMRSKDTGKTKLMNISDIHTTQAGVGADNLRAHQLKSKDDLSYDKAPPTAEIGGKTYLLDGHHRVARAALAGRAKIRVQVWQAGQ